MTYRAFLIVFSPHVFWCSSQFCSIRAKCWHAFLPLILWVAFPYTLLVATVSGCRNSGSTRFIFVLSYVSEHDFPRRSFSVVLRWHGWNFIQVFVCPRGLYRTMCHPVFLACSRLEHSTVRCPRVSRHEQAHRLMASMGLSRLDDPSLWTEHSRTAGDTASSSSLISPRLLQVFLAIAFRLYISGACRGVDPLSSACMQIWSIRMCTCSLHQFNYLVLVRSCDVKTYPADPRSKKIKLSDVAVRRSLRSVRDSVVSLVETCASMAYETFHLVLGGDIRITPVLFALHLLQVLVSGSITSVSERCLEVQNWVLRGFRGYSGPMLGSMVDTCSASVTAALGRRPACDAIFCHWS